MHLNKKKRQLAETDMTELTTHLHGPNNILLLINKGGLIAGH